MNKLVKALWYYIVTINLPAKAALPPSYWIRSKKHNRFNNNTTKCPSVVLLDCISRWASTYLTPTEWTGWNMNMYQIMVLCFRFGIWDHFYKPHRIFQNIYIYMGYDTQMGNEKGEPSSVLRRISKIQGILIYHCPFKYSLNIIRTDHGSLEREDNVYGIWQGKQLVWEGGKRTTTRLNP